MKDTPSAETHRNPREKAAATRAYKKEAEASLPRWRAPYVGPRLTNAVIDHTCKLCERSILAGDLMVIRFTPAGRISEYHHERCQRFTRGFGRTADRDYPLWVRRHGGKKPGWEVRYGATCQEGWWRRFVTSWDEVESALTGWEAPNRAASAAVNAADDAAP